MEEVQVKDSAAMERSLVLPTCVVFVWLPLTSEMHCHESFCGTPRYYSCLERELAAPRCCIETGFVALGPS